ncbi:MAG: hypothetical protein U0P45_13325 [Acidimicrobiales bacterium]
MTLQQLALGLGSFTLDSGRPRSATNQADANVPVIGQAGAGFGNAYDRWTAYHQPRAIVTAPPSLLRTEVHFPTSPDGLGPPVGVLGTFALDRGRLTLAGPRLVGSDRWFASRISVLEATRPAGSADGVTFRVIRRTRQLTQPTPQDVVVFEQTLAPGEGAIDVRVHVGVVAQMRAQSNRLVLEVESAGTGRPLTGVWERPRLGTSGEVDVVTSRLSVTSLFVEWNDGVPGVKTTTSKQVPPSQLDPGIGPTYWSSPDDPYLEWIVYRVDGTTVTARIGSDPTLGGDVVASAAGGFETDVAAKSYQDYFTSFGGGFPLGTYHGGVQPGMGASPGIGWDVALAPMGGDGDPEASFTGIILIALDNESVAIGPDIAKHGLGRFLADARAALDAIIAPGSGRTGLTKAESQQLQAALRTIGDAMVEEVYAPAIGGSPGDGLVGTVHHIYTFADLLLGLTDQTSSVEGSGSRYRITTRCLGY